MNSKETNKKNNSPQQNPPSVKAKTAPISNPPNKNTSNNKVNIKSKNSNQNTSKLALFLVPGLLILGFIIVFLFTGTTFSIKGKVVINDDELTALNGVKIVLDDKKTIENSDDATFTIKGVKLGEHKLTFEKTGFTPYTQNINVKNSEELKLVIRMSEINNKIKKVDFVNFISFSPANSSVNFIAPQENRKIDISNASKDIIFKPDAKKMYILNSIDNNISIIDTQELKEINKLQLPNNSTPIKMAFSKFNQKLYVLLSSNSISVIDTKNDTFLKERKEINDLNGAKDIFINTNSNTLLVVSDNKVASYNEIGDFFDEFIAIENIDVKSGIYTDKNLYLIGSNQEIRKINLLEKKETKIPLNFTPVDLTSDINKGLYIFSNDKLTILNSETGDFIKSDISTNLSNVLKVKVQNYDNKIYIIEKDSNYVSFFDIKLQQIITDKLKLDFQPERLVFYE